MIVEMYLMPESPREPPKKPPGVYTCPECSDAVIVWRTPIDEYKTKCPKCSVQMARTAPVPIPIPVTATASFAKVDDKLEPLIETYTKDKVLARTIAAANGIDINKVALYAGMRQAITGGALGLKHGKEEAAGVKGAPGALKLLIMRLLHGEGYVIGRQKGLGGQHGGTKSTASAAPAVLKALVT